jgi:large subunit ribosomal protein L13
MMKRSKTYSLKKGDIQKAWHVVDASGQTLGRLSTHVATLLMGKHKPTYSPHLDMGDFVIVVNADKIRVTGKKLENKIYYRHTGYVGGLKETPLEEMLQRKPQRVLELAVRGMLPRNKLSRHLLGHLKVYAGPEHPHVAQVRGSEKQARAPLETVTSAATPAAEEKAAVTARPTPEETAAVAAATTDEETE